MTNQTPSTRFRGAYLSGLGTEIRQAFSGAFGMLNGFGVAMGSISAFNLLRKALQFGLAPVFVSIVEAYELIAYKVFFDSLFFWLRIPIPDYAKDCAILWCSGFGVCLRTNFTVFKASNRGIYSTNRAMETTLILGMLGAYEQVMPPFVKLTSVFNNRMLISLLTFFTWPLLVYSILSFDGSEKGYSSAIVELRRTLMVQFLLYSFAVVLLLVTNAGLPNNTP